MSDLSDYEELEVLASEQIARIESLEQQLAEANSRVDILQADLAALRLDKSQVGEQSLRLLRQLEKVLTRRICTDRPARRSEKLEELLAARRTTGAPVKLCCSEMDS